jgi:hypothetical protein
MDIFPNNIIFQEKKKVPNERSFENLFYLVYKFASFLHDETCKEETEQYSWDLAK